MKIGIVGTGSWGTTLSILLAENKHDITIWSYEKEVANDINEFRENKKYLSGYSIPHLVTATTKMEDIKDSEIVFFASPSQHTRSVAGQAAKIIDKEAIIVNAAKGLELNSLKSMTQILTEELSPKKLAVISGPNLSKEIVRGYPAATVAASKDKKIAEQVQKILMSNRFRVYTSTDPLGVELGGTLKNVIAIAAGIVDGLWLGNNAKAALMVRGITEITKLGVAMGGKAQTFAGLSGIGDLITTCMSSLSRNHYVGEQIAKGKKIGDILSAMKEVAEGVPTTKAVKELSKKHKIDMPISNEIYAVLYEGKNPTEAIESLMTRAPKAES